MSFVHLDTLIHNCTCALSAQVRKFAMDAVQQAHAKQASKAEEAQRLVVASEEEVAKVGRESWEVGHHGGRKTGKAVGGGEKKRLGEGGSGSGR